MSLILNIETSTSVCSVALSQDEKIIEYRESPDDKLHSTQLIPFIEEVFKSSGVFAKDLDAVAVSKGPGSYTGLRIGVSTAKGIAYSVNKPLIAIGTLLCMTLGLREEMPQLFKNENTLLCPMIDARRMEVYLTLFNNRLENVIEVRAEILNENSFKQILFNKSIVFFGNGMEKCRKVIQHENAVFIENCKPLARYLAIISHTHYIDQKFENLAYFEPFYLKDFIATIPKDFLGNAKYRTT